jgi:flagellar basal-body rod protein FlgF
VIKGLYSAYSALSVAWKFQGAIANNVANTDTIGFKRELALLGSYDNVLLSESTPTPAPLNSRIQQVVGQIGTGTFVAEVATDFTDGGLEETGRDLDLALADGFFVIEDEAGERFYTRDGRFQRADDGTLITSHGLFVLDTDNQRITVPGGALTVDEGGLIVGADGQEVATINVLDFGPGDLVRAGEAFFQSSVEGTPIFGGMVQGALESSNSDLVDELTTLMAVFRTFQANQTILATLDRSLQTATERLGEV